MDLITVSRFGEFGVNAFRELLDHPFIELWDIAGLAAGDEPIIDDTFFVDPLCTGILEISA